MLKLLLTRLRQGKRTSSYPEGEPGLPARFRGRPVLEPRLCPDGCKACADACPTGAVETGGLLKVDLGRCLFCAECVLACPEGGIGFSNDHRLAAGRREDLVAAAGEEARLARALDEKLLRVLGRSLKLRQVCAGGCSACEAELNALGNVVFDLGRFGVQFVASPRHADGLVVTGPVSGNMREALRAAYDAVPEPKIVIAVGACGISGGPFAGSPEVEGGADKVVPVDLYIPGCPPHPLTVLDGLLRLLGKLEERGGKAGARAPAPASQGAAAAANVPAKA